MGQGKPLLCCQNRSLEVHWDPTPNHCSQVKLGGGDAGVLQKTQSSDLHVQVTQLGQDLGAHAA